MGIESCPGHPNSKSFQAVSMRVLEMSQYLTNKSQTVEVISNKSSFHIEEWTWFLKPETEGIVSVTLLWAYGRALVAGAQQPLNRAAFEDQCAWHNPLWKEAVAEGVLGSWETEAGCSLELLARSPEGQLGFYLLFFPHAFWSRKRIS